MVIVEVFLKRRSMDEKAVLAEVKAKGTREVVQRVLLSTPGVDPRTAVIVAEIISLLEAQRVVRRGSIVDFLSRTDTQLKKL